jgi:glycosyltransferase involved in cell wall biosynthesis
LIRTFNSTKTLERCIQSVRRQSVPADVLVVDSGSTDDTVALAAGLADEVVQLPRESFTYGRALNVGFEAADAASIVLPLSSHCWMRTSEHVAAFQRLHEDTSVAAATGAIFDPYGKPILAAYFETEWPANGKPWWGFSNTCCSVRRDVWLEHPFDESLPACEDKEWASRVLASGYRIVYDPCVAVISTHRRTQGLKHSFHRGRREGQALQAIMVSPRLTGPYLLRKWFWEVPQTARFWRPLYYAMPHRVAEVSGLWRGAKVTYRTLDRSGTKIPSRVGAYVEDPSPRGMARQRECRPRRL